MSTRVVVSASTAARADIPQSTMFNRQSWACASTEAMRHPHEEAVLPLPCRAARANNRGVRAESDQEHESSDVCQLVWRAVGPCPRLGQDWSERAV